MTKNTDLPGDIEPLFNRLGDLVDTGDSELLIREPFTGENEPDRYRLRLRHADTCESDIGMRYTQGEFEAFLDGLVKGYEQAIERKSDR